jgi:hypothetical protein
VAKLLALMPTAEHPEDDRPTATAAVVRCGEPVSVLGRSPGPAAPGFQRSRACRHAVSGEMTSKPSAAAAGIWRRSKVT